METLPCDLLRAISSHLLPRGVLSLAMACTWTWATLCPDVSPPILCTNVQSDTLFEKSPRGYVVCDFPFPKERTDQYKRRLIDSIVESGKDDFTERDVALLLCALEHPHILYHHDRVLLKFAALKCIAPLFVAIADVTVRTQCDANMVQLLAASCLTQDTKHSFLKIMLHVLRSFDALDWCIKLARDYGMHDVSETLTEFSLRRLQSCGSYQHSSA